MYFTVTMATAAGAQHRKLEMIITVVLFMSDQFNFCPDLKNVFPLTQSQCFPHTHIEVHFMYFYYHGGS